MVTLSDIGKFIRPVGDIIGGGLGLYNAASALKSPSPRLSTGNIPTSFNTPSLGLNLQGGQATLTRAFDPRSIEEGFRTRLRGIGDSFGGLRENIARLKADVSPGFGRLTNARVTAVRDAAGAARSNLRESLAKRRVLGSSFAADAETRLNLQFAQEEEKVRAASFVEELSLSLGLEKEDAALLAEQVSTINAEAEALKLTLNREFLEMGLTRDIALGITKLVEDVAALNANMMVADEAAKAQDLASLFGDTGALASLGSGITSLGGALGGIGAGGGFAGVGAGSGIATGATIPGFSLSGGALSSAPSAGGAASGGAASASVLPALGAAAGFAAFGAFMKNRSAKRNAAQDRQLTQNMIKMLESGTLPDINDEQAINAMLGTPLGNQQLAPGTNPEDLAFVTNKTENAQFLANRARQLIASGTLSPAAVETAKKFIALMATVENPPQAPDYSYLGGLQTTGGR